MLFGCDDDDSNDKEPFEATNDSIEEIFGNISTLHGLLCQPHTRSLCLWYLWFSDISSVN